jgi:DNA polymerase III subunit delta'
MALAQVLGQERAVSAISSTLGSGQVAHAWLLVGPSGVGKELCATGLAQALVCEDQPMKGCGACAACRRVDHGNHPDVTFVRTEDELVRRGVLGRSDLDHVPSRDLKVEQVRGLQERLAYRPLEAKWKVAILTPADALNHQAQNALLKTLEEPPRDTVLVLVTSAPDRLLPTIRSRCARVQFAPLPQAVIADRLAKDKKLSPAEAQVLARMAQGSLARAFALDAGTGKKRKETIEQFCALDPRDARGWLQLAEALAEDRPTAEAALEVLNVWLHDVAVARAGGTDLVNADLEALAVAQAAKVSPATLARSGRLVDEARNAISARNGGIRVQLERMFIEMFAPS